MRADSKILSNASSDLPVSADQFRISANITEDQLNNDDLNERILNAVNILETKTGFSIVKGTYTLQWDYLPTSPRLSCDAELVFPGFYGTVNTVEYQNLDNNWVTLPNYILSERSEMGSIRIKPKDGRWDMLSYLSIRVTGTAGCDQTDKLPGIFSESLALIFRSFYYGESESMNSAEALVSRWITTGSLL